MDYTLIHYDVQSWEASAYSHVKRLLKERGLPVDDLEFDAELVVRGLVIDTELGNIVKANRFGFVKQACHGTRDIEFVDYRQIYAQEMVDLSDSRWRFLNTFFAISEGCLYMQLVDKLDAGELGEIKSYLEVYKLLRSTMDHAHLEGRLKAEIVGNPDKFVVLDEDAALALLDQKNSGKKLVIITNSGWEYTKAMMAFAYDRFLPGEMKWRDLFDLVIVDARKPSFFFGDNPVFEVIDEEGRLKPSYSGMELDKTYLGGNARMVEAALDCPGEDILFVGDHLYSDVNVSKRVSRWRTALVVRELEAELEAIDAFSEKQDEIQKLMRIKEGLEWTKYQLRLGLQRLDAGYGSADVSKTEIETEMNAIRVQLAELDLKIAPLAAEAAKAGSSRWGLIMRAGNDKSHMARQVERYADVYLAKVGDFAAHTPFAYLRSARGSLPHDPD